MTKCLLPRISSATTTSVKAPSVREPKAPCLSWIKDVYWRQPFGLWQTVNF